jgi:hypothetical protein
VFNWFRKPPPALHDCVWLNQVARDEHIATTAAQATQPLLLVAFFAETAELLAQLLRDRGIAFAEVGPMRALRPVGVPVLLALAERVAQVHANPGETWQFCVAEHHPLPEPNTALIEQLQRLGPQTPVFHSALDEPLMLRFGGERVAALMLRLNMPANEPVQSPIVAKALANARDKVRKKVVAPLPARSLRGWLAANLPD